MTAINKPMRKRGGQSKNAPWTDDFEPRWRSLKEIRAACRTLKPEPTPRQMAAVEKVLAYRRSYMTAGAELLETAEYVRTAVEDVVSRLGGPDWMLDLSKRNLVVRWLPQELHAEAHKLLCDHFAGRGVAIPEQAPQETDYAS